MNQKRTKRRLMRVVCGLSVLAAAGCQADVGGQTLPSAYYLRDDVQFFPAGPETQLPNLRRALAEYRAEQAAIEGGLDGAPLPVAPPVVPPPGAVPPGAVPPGAFPP